MSKPTSPSPLLPGVQIAQEDPALRKRGPKAKPIVEFPEATASDWIDPPLFHEALRLHAQRHGETVCHLHRSLANQGDHIERSTLLQWAAGKKLPRTIASLAILNRIERRYRLPDGYFKSKLPNQSRTLSGHKRLKGVSAAERRRMAWHLPNDFDDRPAAERREILEWVRTVIISGATDYRRYQAAASRDRFAIRFPDLTGRKRQAKARREDDEDERFLADIEREIVDATVDAPPDLAGEVADLIRFKMSTLTEIGFQRNGVWNEQTAFQKVEHLGLLFGALAASPRGKVVGRGVPVQALSMAMLVFPSVWDWYIQWRETRRGCYTAWEINMLHLGLSLARSETGWLRQHPALGERLVPIPGLISEEDIAVALADWEGACDRFYRFGTARAKEVQRVAKVHRDPFEPIMVVLEAESPVGSYRLITDEIMRLMPDRRRYPRAAAESVRAFLMLRFGLHLGLRQKNLRELLICPRGTLPTSERQLTAQKRGELRWSARDGGWEVFIPSSAFKNAHSSFFRKMPFRLLLPDLGELYQYIDAYVSLHRAALLSGADDPGTFFVKTVKTTSRDAAYDQNTFYEAWRLIIQRYGIHNPYTERGAIKGLLPHGPHNVRDVLATHILKLTGSYEQASYAIQDTPDTVAKHYGRFLPQDKAALAAQILNRVWEAA